MDPISQESQDGNRYLLVVVDTASKFLFAYPLPSKDTVGVSRKLLELLLTFGVPLSIQSDAGGEFSAQVVKHLCQWLRMSIDGPANHPRAQGAAERVGGWLQEVLSEPCKSWPRILDRYVLPACWIQRAPQTLVYLRLPHHFVYCLVEMLAYSWTQLRLSLMVWDIKEDWRLLWRNNKPSERYVKP